jgi:hypothetical protein
MTTNQYLTALKTLGLTRASKKTAAALGVTVRQCQRYADGDQAVPETVALLLRCYVELGGTQIKIRKSTSQMIDEMLRRRD